MFVFWLTTSLLRLTSFSQGKHVEAEPLYERSQAIRENVLGLEHPDVAESLNSWAALLGSQVGIDLFCALLVAELLAICGPLTYTNQHVLAIGQVR